MSVRTGYPIDAVEHAFDCLFSELSRGSIEDVIVDELGSLEVLDRFVPLRARGQARAAPLGSICIISSRTTIGVAIVPAIFALCAKCDVLVKDREDHLVAAFFRTLGEELPELNTAARAQSWTSENTADLGRFDGVVAFGSDAALSEIGAGLPLKTIFIGFGSKASAGYVAREALENEASAQSAANAAALDLVLYESEGCLSLHALFVERNAAISVERFGAMLAGAVRMQAAELSSRPRASALRIAMARDVATFRSSAPVHSEPQAGFLTVIDPPFAEPPLFLPRTLGIRPVDTVTDMAEYLLHHGIALEGLAVTQGRSDLLEAAVRLRIPRVVGMGRLQAPPLGAFHGGRPRIAEFVRWIGNET